MVPLAEGRNDEQGPFIADPIDHLSRKSPILAVVDGGRISDCSLGIHKETIAP
ncbi:hypothetical protein [Brucella anthropi]|uniref:hypothetical protein n=1 Tax=Brucella anthropi TaxID=529 RepID=UPI0023603D3B|nr:hypothetical protein [Brucella anthropi]